MSCRLWILNNALHSNNSFLGGACFEAHYSTCTERKGLFTQLETEDGYEIAVEFELKIFLCANLHVNPLGLGKTNKGEIATVAQIKWKAECEFFKVEN